MIGDNGRPQYLRFCLLKCMLMFFFCHKLVVQCSELNFGYIILLYIIICSVVAARFNVALFSVFEQTFCSFVACNSKYSLL